MAVGEEKQVRRHFSRRSLVRGLSLGMVATLVGGLFHRGIPFSSGRRSVPRDLPGEGSIFQPRNDPRYRA